MKTYNLYKNSSGQLELVKDGWSWPGFFFTWIWAFIKGMPGLGFGLILAFFSLDFFLASARAPGGFLNICAFFAAIWLGSNGNQMREKN